jgi:polygalacturonase
MLGMAGLAALGGVASTLPAAAADNARLSGLPIFDVRNHGAKGNGTSLDTDAINQAIASCSSAGGGLVYVPPGNYLCGTIILKSNVTFYLEAGATLLGSKKLSDYTPQSLVSCALKKQAFSHDLKDAGVHHLLFACNAENIALAGLGKIDGQGPSFWKPSGRKKPSPEDGWKDVATFDWKPLPRPSPMLEFYNCKNVHIENVRIENSAGWTLRPILCDNVFIHGIQIKNPVYGPNTDGIDLVCCRNVFISDCLVETGDDALCLKSENPYGGDVMPSKNITITNCVLSGCCNGFKFGTATYGSFENIVFTNSVIFNDDVPLNSRIISGIALQMVDGGSVEGVNISNICMQRVRTPIFIRRANRHPGSNGNPGKLRGVLIENISATKSILTSSITGLVGFDVEDVRLSGIHIESDEAGKSAWMNRAIPEAAKAYPEARMFGRLPAYGLYCRHVKGLRLENIEFKAAAKEDRPAIFCEDVKDLKITGLTSTPIVGNQPVIKLTHTSNAFIQGCTAPADTNTFVELQGGQTKDVVLMNNNLVSAENIVQADNSIPKETIIALGNASRNNPEKNSPPENKPTAK